MTTTITGERFTGTITLDDEKPIWSELSTTVPADDLNTLRQKLRVCDQKKHRHTLVNFKGPFITQNTILDLQGQPLQPNQDGCIITAKDFKLSPGQSIQLFKYLGQTTGDSEAYVFCSIANTTPITCRKKQPSLCP